jgi:hypothetical protein
VPLYLQKIPHGLTCAAGTPLWEAGDQQPDPWHDLKTKVALNYTENSVPTAWSTSPCPVPRLKGSCYAEIKSVFIQRIIRKAEIISAENARFLILQLTVHKNMFDTGL